MSNKKLSIIGGGNIGGLIAYIAGTKRIHSIVLLDLDSDMVKAKALDLMHCSAMNDWNSTFVGTSDYSNIVVSDVVVIAAGASRKPGMTRADLITINASIISDIAKKVKEFAPDAFVIVITNPLDVMVSFFQKCSGFAYNMVVGMAGELDNSRFRAFLAEELAIQTNDIRSLVIGEHGASMLYVMSELIIGGVNIADLLQVGNIQIEKVERAFERAKNAGAEIVSLFKTGSAYKAPATVCMEMVESYLSDKKRFFCASAYLSAEYCGQKEIYIGVPVSIGSDGVENIKKVKLDADELQKFHVAGTNIRKLIELLPEPC